MKLTHLVIFISALFCHQLSAQIQNPDNCALSDYCASVGQYYKAQADIKSELVNTALTINYKTPTEKLIKIAWNTNKTYELVRSLEVLAIKGLNGTQIIHPESSGLINNLSGKDEYETWLFDEDNYSVDPDAKKIFTEMGYVLNDYTRWKIIKSSSNFDKLLPLFFSIPDKGIYKVITAWIERESKPTLAQKIITNFISDAIALGFMSMGIAPTDLFAEAPLMVRSTKGRIFKLEPKDPLGAGTPYRNNMDMPFGSSYRPKTPLSKDIESIFVLK
ncbi:MAG: hypothetical protein NTY22_05445 [Proteobacteria bacterium]|nr:hypothetical protein [Pseudomonadota bacterium]